MNISLLTTVMAAVTKAEASKETGATGLKAPMTAVEATCKAITIITMDQLAAEAERAVNSSISRVPITRSLKAGKTTFTKMTRAIKTKKGEAIRETRKGVEVER